MTEPFSYAGEQASRFDRAYLWHYRARWLYGEYLDGDTFTVLVDTGFHGREEVRIRIPGRFSPEMGESGGSEAAEQLRDALERSNTDLKWNLRLVTRQLVTKADESTTFERYVADTYLVLRDGSLFSLTEQLAYLANSGGNP